MPSRKSKMIFGNQWTGPLLSSSQPDGYSIYLNALMMKRVHLNLRPQYFGGARQRLIPPSGETIVRRGLTPDAVSGPRRRAVLFKKCGN
jgi:hypothetical protein